MDQTEKKKGGNGTEKTTEGIHIPTENSPYTRYSDLEDYKRRAYGAEGHLQPKPGRGAAASTDAPTVSGGAAPDHPPQQSATDAINRHGVP